VFYFDLAQVLTGRRYCAEIRDYRSLYSLGQGAENLPFILSDQNQRQ